jgi:glycogen(starch) synthase
LPHTALYHRAIRVLAVGNVYPPHHLRGYELIWQGVTDRLRADGHAARILVTGYRSPHAGAVDDTEIDIHRELRWYWRDHEWPRLRPLQRLAVERHNAAVFDRHLREFKPDVIAWWPMGGMSMSLIERARRARIPAVMFVLDYWPSYGPQHDLWTRMWAPRPRAGALVGRLTGLPTRPDLAAAGRWVFCSASMRDATLATGLQVGAHSILHPGVAGEYIQATGSVEEPPWRWRLLYLGRVVEQKGVRTAVQALAELPDEARLRIVGDGDEPYRQELEQLAARLGLSHRVSFEPAKPRAEVLDVYRWADVVVFPVDWPEPWGLVPLEAMALGTLVVATGRGGSGEFLADGANSLLFEAGNTGLLARAVQRLASDAALRDRLRSGGRATAAEHGEDAFNECAVREMESAAAGGRVH